MKGEDYGEKIAVMARDIEYLKETVGKIDTNLEKLVNKVNQTSVTANRNQQDIEKLKSQRDGAINWLLSHIAELALGGISTLLILERLAS